VRFEVEFPQTFEFLETGSCRTLVRFEVEFPQTFEFLETGSHLTLMNLLKGTSSLKTP
jgi:hypothetical protein